METQLVVLGGGPGGYAAAFLAADLGMKVTLVEREARLGGVCLLRGCIPSKALLHVAKVTAEARYLADWGVAFDPPRLDLDTMRKRKDKIIATLTGGLKQLAAKRKVTVVRAQAKGCVKVLGGWSHVADGWLFGLEIPGGNGHVRQVTQHLLTVHRRKVLLRVAIRHVGPGSAGGQVRSRRGADQVARLHIDLDPVIAVHVKVSPSIGTDIELVVPGRGMGAK